MLSTIISANLKVLPAVTFRGVLYLAPVVFLEGIRWLSGETFSWPGLIGRTVFVVLVLLWAIWGRSYLLRYRVWTSGRFDLLVVIVGFGVISVYLSTATTWSAWGTLGIFYVGLLNFSRTVRDYTNVWLRGGIWAFLILIAGAVPVAINQIETNFADEEFFVAVQAFVLGLFWLLLSIAVNWSFGIVAEKVPSSNRRVIYWQGAILAVGLYAVIFSTVRAYQRSFFPATAPTYPGISEDTPFLCEKIDPEAEQISGSQIREHLITFLTTAPYQSTATLGNLALYTREPSYAVAFRESLLREAEAGLYTSPANSVKWGQFEAALRAYQFYLIDQTFPSLFSSEDKRFFKSWFAQINRRAMTTEWVDWLYAIAYRKPPAGPYENQEIGAGLLAVLANTGLAAPDLAERNAEYLATTALGWQDLFRNTDDTYVYQAVWLSNAWWIYNYERSSGLSTPTAEQNMRLSFLWLLALALPDGETLSYNVQGSPSLAEYYLAGAMLSQDPRLTWLTHKALTRRIKETDGYLLHSGLLLGEFNLPKAAPPDVGSCLIFGNSGVPTTKGPLAPDKIVLRDGWRDDSTYALLNLRFSGWHRYKATNTLTLLYQNGPLVTEKWTTSMSRWLPKGRAAFRDKRVPRENLNGMLLPKSGLARVVWGLSSIGGRWMQNPPPYADVEEFFSSSVFDSSRTVISDWNGWRQERTIYLIHEGLVLVVDQANTHQIPGPAAVVWHLNGTGQLEKDGLRLDNERRPARLVWSEDASEAMSLKSEIPGDLFLRNPNWELLYTSPKENELNLATAFLSGGRVEGDMQLKFIADNLGLIAVWQHGQEGVWLLHNRKGDYLAYDGLGTDGTTLILVRGQSGKPASLCYINSQMVSVTLPNSPRQILAEAGTSLPSTITWQFANQRLTINLGEQPASGCLLLE